MVTPRTRTERDLLGCSKKSSKACLKEQTETNWNSWKNLSKKYWSIRLFVLCWKPRARTESQKFFNHRQKQVSLNLKTIGQEKGKLSFVSLARQIEGALQKVFKALEVVDAVVRAINPGMRLRSSLEGLESLRVPFSKMYTKSATELY